MVTQLKAPIWVPGLSFSSTTPRTTLITTTDKVQYQYSDRVARPEKFTQFRKSDPIASKKVMIAPPISISRRTRSRPAPLFAHLHSFGYRAQAFVGANCDVGFGSKATVWRYPHHFRFSPESRHTPSGVRAAVFYGPPLSAS